ncbi:unnamed protein product, partial [Scytosiphon promiscuus]
PPRHPPASGYVVRRHGLCGKCNRAPNRISYFETCRERGFCTAVISSSGGACHDPSVAFVPLQSRRELRWNTTEAGIFHYSYPTGVRRSAVDHGLGRGAPIRFDTHRLYEARRCSVGV